MKLFGWLAGRRGEEDQPKAAMASSFRRLLLIGSWRKPKNKTVPVVLEMEDGTPVKIIKGAIRVKLALSKKEAAQLLAMYVRGQEELSDKLVGELDSTKSSSRSSGSSSGSWRPMLESIPEN
ncbi:hypothetical protein ZIOFF_007920 [Zingiber officinale]|uniref:Uncharacterized protein n=1 Tax=Zingiber officinale TaxID=94328 RepID=A0A8J5I2G8_ZINOF|nr:hypothetical protein ZIOFF_007920 [Zingiber officinale]